ncbi:MAG TPA: glycine cleavage system protein GcvH [Phycisphaerae bacterium]|nr:glycine cleavage system protein GcvH [Phycisphaerales bacterium]HNO79548.1 glycine cleavage system protein GcvH [Phycisphaerae bacterium]
MSVPNDRKYSDSHEWYMVDGNVVTIGITEFAAEELTDITYVELPAVGKECAAGAAVGEIESVKATSDLISAIGGKVVAVNEELADHPELVNDDAHNRGWMIKIEASDLSPLDDLMDAAAYGEHVG